jgi:lipopolysaccharide assembly protein A
MQYQLIAALGVVLLILVFANQNAGRVSVVFLLWRIDASLAVVIASCFGLGVTISALVIIPRMLRDRLLLNRLREQVETLSAENDNSRSRRVVPVQL